MTVSWFSFSSNKFANAFAVNPILAAFEQLSSVNKVESSLESNHKLKLERSFGLNVDNKLAFHNLRSTEKIVLKSSKEKINLQLLIGDDEYIEMNRKLLLPKLFSFPTDHIITQG